jgi:tetraacyldisaccharide 4'-kinase
VAPPADFVNTRTLPFGRFREPLEAAAAADALLVPSDSGNESSRDRMAERLKVKRAFSFTRTVAAPLDPPADSTPRASLGVFAFAGIAKPEDFFTELERAGWHLAGRRAFADHHVYSANELEALQRQAQECGAASLVTTSKDIVKLEFVVSAVSQTFAPALPIVDVPLQISIEPAFRSWLHERLAKARAA